MGELARKPGAPGLPRTPEELLIAGPGEGFSWLEKNSPPVITGLIGFTTPGLVNWRLMRPFFAGIYRHIIFGALAYGAGDWYYRTRREQKAEKDAILLHYISLHPEDFPPIERKRYKEIFAPWTPKR